jgi:hypothetical protein
MFSSGLPGAGMAISGQSIASLPLLSQCRGGRKSSYDRTGENSDWVYIPARTETKIAEIEGPGIITHIWIPFSPDFFKRIVLRMYWDGESNPSVETPMTDFFGSSLGEGLSYSSALTSIVPVGGYNCYFPMPFERSAVVSITHEDDKPIERLYFQVDYLTLPDPLKGMGTLHAQYRQSGDANHPIAKRENGSLEHLALRAQGRGHLVGCTYSVIANVEGNWKSLREAWHFNQDGDRSVLIDDGIRAVDGAEHLRKHSYDLSGRPYVLLDDLFLGQFCRYRWFLEAPPTFQREFELNLVFQPELDANLRTRSVCYWYQTEPHTKFPTFPAVEDRMLRS